MPARLERDRPARPLVRECGHSLGIHPTSGHVVLRRRQRRPLPVHELRRDLVSVGIQVFAVPATSSWFRRATAAWSWSATASPAAAYGTCCARTTTDRHSRSSLKAPAGALKSPAWRTRACARTRRSQPHGRPTAYGARPTPASAGPQCTTRLRRVGVDPSRPTDPNVVVFGRYSGGT